MLIQFIGFSISGIAHDSPSKLLAPFLDVGQISGFLSLHPTPRWPPLFRKHDPRTLFKGDDYRDGFVTKLSTLILDNVNPILV